MEKQPEFDEIYRLYAADLYRYLLRLTGDAALAEDILQDTMLKAFTGIDKFRGDCSMKTWLCTLARNLWRDHLKKAENRNLPLEESWGIADGSDPGAILQTMPESAKFPQYAMLFLYEQAESRLGAQMMALSQNIVDADNA